MTHRRLGSSLLVCVVCVTLACSFAWLPLHAGSITTAKPEDVGLSSERLARIHEAVQRHIDAGSLAGAVTLVSRNGRIAHLEAHGLIDVEAKRPMPRDGVFRLASMSKPVTAVAVMMMLEEGKLRLNDPVSRFIPEFKSAKVAVARPGARGGAAPPAGPQAGRGGPPPEVDLVSATREVTIRDLLTHGSGLMSGGLGNAVAGQAAARTPSDTLATYIPKLGAVPLDFQPGTLWRYSGLAGFDVLSRVVEVASGKTFDQFLRERLFDPLGMKDTGFTLTAAIQPRLVPLYRRGPNGLERSPDQSGLSSATYFSGAGGLVSTAEDYAQLATMLVMGGELNGKRYLSPRTIELMASNHTGDLAGGQMGMSPRGIGFGLGVQVVEDPVAADRRVTKGAWGWAGAYGTNVHIEPAAGMVTIILMQTSTPALQRDFENAVAQAVIK
ncbi:MAG TPA: serine hydrolase domain-containing protein [Vicinamibacterales bacterium]|nr:serine hydrolase domain-containing protein [Vicinamibacterales bacterium]